MGPPDARDAAAPDRWMTLIDGDGAVAGGPWLASPAQVVCPRAASRACACGAALHCIAPTSLCSDYDYGCLVRKHRIH